MVDECCAARIVPHPNAKLLITIISARGLRQLYWLKNQSPYCRVIVGKSRIRYLDDMSEDEFDHMWADDTHVKKTATVSQGGCNPVWPEGDGSTLCFEWDPRIETDAGQLYIGIYDDDGGQESEHDFVGESCFNMGSLAHTGTFEGEVCVYSYGTVPAGYLTVRITCENMQEIAAAELACSTPAKVHRNYVTGAIHRYHESSDMSIGDAFTTHQVALQNVASICGDVWHAGIHGIRGDTFQPGVKGKAYKVVRNLSHRMLYCDGYTGSGNNQIRTTSQFLGNRAQDFLQLVNYGIRGLHRRVFTYVIVDEGMFFSETSIKVKHITGASLSMDKCSKHATHANGADKVRFAGTFRVCQYPPAADGKEGTYVLVIDNDSGTYMPSAKHFGILKDLLETNFIGLEVLTLDQTETEQPAHTTTLLGPIEAKNAPGSVYDGKWIWAHSDCAAS